MHTYRTKFNPIFLQATDTTYLQNWIELSRSAVEHNVNQFAQWLGPNTALTAVIKSNGYGHGLVEMAQLYDRIDAIAALCTINLSEAITIRQHQIKKRIIVIGYIDADYTLLIDHQIETILYDIDTAKKLDQAAYAACSNIKVHIKIDTGMSRLGIFPEQLDDFLKQIATLQNLQVVGIFSHLAQGYDPVATKQQATLFTQAAPAKIAQHLANSHGSLMLVSKAYHYARIGIGLYGYLQKGTFAQQQQLQPVLSLKARILQIKDVPAGTSIGYDGLYKALQPMKIATIAIGYHEGLDARLAHGGYVLINDHRAHIIGRVCMNLTIIDISHIGECIPGTIVTVIGKNKKNSINMYDWSAISQATVYNHLTKLSADLVRLIVD